MGGFWSKPSFPWAPKMWEGHPLHESEWENKIMVLALRVQTMVPINQWLPLFISIAFMLWKNSRWFSSIQTFFFSLSSPLPTHLCSVYLVRRNNCECCWQQSNGVSRGQKFGVGNRGDRQTTKGTGERQEEDWSRGQAGCRQPSERSWSCGITSHCDDWCPVMTQSQQTAAVWLSTPRSPGLSLVPVLLCAVCLIPPAQPFFRPHSLCSPPVPSHQPHPDPSSCRTERTKLSYSLIKAWFMQVANIWSEDS